MCKWGTDGIVYVVDEANSMPGWQKKNNLPNRADGWFPVPVDACIAAYIQRMNDLGIKTKCCCCGHGKTSIASVLVREESEGLMVQLGYAFTDYHVVKNDGGPRDWLEHHFVVPALRRSVDPRDEGCLCQACGVRYRGDLLVPDGVWNKIRNGLNLLCPTCTMNRIIDARVWTAAFGFDADDTVSAGDLIVTLPRLGGLRLHTLAVKAAKACSGSPKASSDSGCT